MLQKIALFYKKFLSRYLVKSIISSHNKALLSDYHRSQTQTNEKECNCRKKDQCPLDGKFLTQNVVYQATVSTQSSSETYVGLATNFKDVTETTQHLFDIKARETKLNCYNTFGHSKTITNLLTTSGELLGGADLIATLATNVTYAFLRSL